MSDAVGAGVRLPGSAARLTERVRLPGSAALAGVVSSSEEDEESLLGLLRRPDRRLVVGDLNRSVWGVLKVSRCLAADCEPRGSRDRAADLKADLAPPGPEEGPGLRAARRSLSACRRRTGSRMV